MHTDYPKRKTVPRKHERHETVSLMPLSITFHVFFIIIFYLVILAENPQWTVCDCDKPGVLILRFNNQQLTIPIIQYSVIVHNFITHSKRTVLTNGHIQQGVLHTCDCEA